jgi:hypothetical protein
MPNPPLSVPNPDDLPADIKKLDQSARALIITDAAGESEAMEILASATLKIRATKEECECAVAPHQPTLDKVAAIKSRFKIRLDFLTNAKDYLNKGLTTYRVKQEQIQQEAQRKAIEDANKKKREEEEAARKVREDAEAARAAGNEKKAEKLEAKAEQREESAAAVVPQIIEAPTKRIETSTANVSYTDLGKDWVLPGFDKEKKIYADNPIFDMIDMAWLREVCVLDPVRLNALAKANKPFPAPFVLIPKKGTQVRAKNAS